MSAKAPARPAKRTPFALQIVGMMIGGMLLSQLITVALVVFLPPQSTPGYPASAVVALLSGGNPGSSGLVRSTAAAPPVLPADRVHRDNFDEARLAALLHKPTSDVRFYYVHDAQWLESVENIWRPRRPRRRDDPPPADAQQIVGRMTAWLSDPQFPFFGHFVAAVRTGPDRWVSVTPANQSILDEWQLRMLLWLGAGALLIIPAGYLFARRITAPLAEFASAARSLGSDPNSPPVTLDGPAELGVAAEAFNEMQQRLRRYVADRMAMFSAISHDLRTPLARTRFKIERAEPALRDSIVQDLDQMDAMIASVLKFMRDGASAADRRRLDLSSVVDSVVEEAVEAGGQAALTETPGLVVRGDMQALKRLFANLVRNAVAYGGGAEVAVERDGGDVLVKVRDHGPGLPPDELIRVFEPFYRADRARNLDSGGVGLGLAIARSIAREHGGEIHLEAASPGLRAVVRLPLDAPTAPPRPPSGRILTPARA